MKKFFVFLICGSVLSLGSCNLATGTGFGDNTPYIGIDVELVEGFDVFVPVVPFDG